MYALIDGRISFKSINALTLFPSFFSCTLIQEMLTIFQYIHEVYIQWTQGEME